MKKEKLTLYDLFYIFIFGCMFGWFVEGLWTLLKKHLLINHSALVIGPFNMLYGAGAVILSFLLYRIKDGNYFKIFITSFLSGSILEYVASYGMEKLFGFVAWSYKTKILNINGRICLPYSLFWGVLGIIWIKLVFPRLIDVIKNTNHKIGKKIIIILSIFLIFDEIFTVYCIHRGKEYDKGIPPQNKIERVVDEYFGVEYLNNMFNNRWNRN